LTPAQFRRLYPNVLAFRGGGYSIQAGPRSFATASTAPTPPSPLQVISSGLEGAKFRAIDAYLASAIPMAPLTIGGAAIGAPWLGEAASLFPMFLTLGAKNRPMIQWLTARGPRGSISVPRLVRTLI